MPEQERHTLRVEGKDDKYAIKHLLRRHGIGHKVIDIRAFEDEDEDTGGRDRLLQGMKTAVAASTGKSIGFVLDANGAATDRWSAVRSRLDGFELELPKEIPVDGFVGDALEVQARVGVWLMPDNRRTGAIEEFLMDLVGDGDALLQHAKASTEEALNCGADFANAKLQKAVLHAWLAWQRRPGLPYGLAITAHYLRHDSPTALAFVNWFRRVFETPEDLP